MKFFSFYNIEVSLSMLTSNVRIWRTKTNDSNHWCYYHCVVFDAVSEETVDQSYYQQWMGNESKSLSLHLKLRTNDYGPFNVVDKWHQCSRATIFFVQIVSVSIELWPGKKRAVIRSTLLWYKSYLVLAYFIKVLYYFEIKQICDC